MNIDTLLFDGGGSMGVAYIGAIKALEKLQIIPNIKIVSGTSIGAVVGLMVVLGFGSSEIQYLLNVFDIEKGFSLKMINFLRHGVYGNDKYIIKTIKAVIEMKYPHDITCGDLFEKTQKRFVINTTCLCDHKSFSFDHINTPNTPVWLAIRASISIPYIFTPVIYGIPLANGITEKKKYYVDGGVSPLPIHLFNQDTMLVFTFDGDRIKPEGKLYFFKQLLNTISRFHQEQSKYVVSIPSVSGSVSFPDQEQKKEIIRIGYTSTLTYIKENKTLATLSSNM